MSDIDPNAAGDPAPPPAPRRRRRWLVPVLVVSLGLNLIVAGWAGARWAVYGGHWHWSARHVHPELFETWHEYRDERRAMQRQTASALREMADILDASTFDPVAYDATVENISTLGNDLVALGATIAKDVARKIDAEGRESGARHARRLARWLERRADRRPKR